jgi:dTDP-4-amino-4,6-dideoxygalactose transaminase
VRECLDTGWVSGGRFIELFERRARHLTGASEAVACASGTAALHLALSLLGVGPGEEVLVPSLTFIAPVNVVRYTGAEPVFLGCDDFMNLDPAILADFLRRECDATDDGPRNRTTGRIVRAVIPVHVFGNPCDMESIDELARKHRVAVVEDACESFGSRWTSGALAGRHTGTIGSYGAFSFNGNKVVTAGGGGILVTADAQSADRARYLIDQAKDDGVRYVHDTVGYNYRLGNVQAAIGTAQLEELPGFIATRKRNHARYAAALDGVPGLRFLSVPDGTAPNYWFYSLLVEPEPYGMDREALMRVLERAGIQTRPLWYPNHRQAPFRGCQAYHVERAGWFWERLLNLPCSSDLAGSDVDAVAAAIVGAAC